MSRIFLAAVISAVGTLCLVRIFASAPADPQRMNAPAAPPRASPSQVPTPGPPRITIASIGLAEPLSPQGLRGGEINPKPGQVIWYTGHQRVAPGSTGTTVLAGHVAKGATPDVFTNLRKVAIGDTIRTVGPGGAAATYTVSRTYTLPKSELQQDPQIWGPPSLGRRLALITCDDALGRTERGERVANLVVIATAAA
ncbi:MAG: class F sortase [Angustibacter sp.]